MSSETMRNNTAELEEILAMANSLPDAGGSGGINPNLNLLVLGDSLFGKDDGKTFINGLGCNIRNYAVSGASLAEISERRYVGGAYNSMLDQFDRFKNGVSPRLEEKEDINTRLNGNSDFTTPDIILVDGGGNDFIESSALGVPSNSPYTFEDTAPFDRNTVAGALETLLRDIALTYPKAQRFFLIMHRVYYCDVKTERVAKTYWPTTQIYARGLYERTVGGQTVKSWELLFNQNAQKLITASQIKSATKLQVRTFSETQANADGYVKYGSATDFNQDSLYKSGTHPNGTLDESKISWGYTFDTLRETIIKVCNMYGFKIIDIYNDSLLNVVTPTPYTVDGVAEKIANSELLDYKGIHPTETGYKVGYAPYVRQALGLATKKDDT